MGLSEYSEYKMAMASLRTFPNIPTMAEKEATKFLSNF
jgi:hypothetical protein